MKNFYSLLTDKLQDLKYNILEYIGTAITIICFVALITALASVFYTAFTNGI